ncbi:hypothetical protein DLAC_05924 [Tieghemostelium lacteum]|uniref:Uncharacterized protein n=1 Tax=Tieghemostelium lacteum TaxID=361077 RepID=A0A151ZH08_TIELA|nr:hypothetical protein DLAC_05924 [Tieghemostelium lacteum]|eukprot:KYQ93268.1 hypothetical protein DLAC_05924 [Tieghemostelium lacteum]
MTTKIGGKFLEDFQIWRDNKIATQFPDIPKLSAETLTVSNFLAVSTFDVNTKIDIVKDRAQKYFVAILNYYNQVQDESPLNDDILELLKDEKTAQFYREYAKVWLLQVLYHTDEAIEYKSFIRCGEVENELNNLTIGSMMTKQSMMLYFIALKELVPQMLPFIYHRGTFNAKVRTALLDINGTQTVAVQYTRALVDNVNNSNEFDQFKIMELKSKLDLLNPTYRLSNDIIGNNVFTALAFCMSNSFQSSSLNKAIYYHTILKVLKRILRDPGNQFLDLVNSFVKTFGDVIKASDNITQLFNMVTLGSKKSLKNLHVLTFATKATVLPFKAATVDSTFEPLKSHPLFYKFLNGLLCACQIGTIAYCLYNHESMKEFDVTKLYAGKALFVHEYIDAVASNRIYIRMGEFIREITKSMNPVSVAKAFQIMIPRVVDETSRTLISKLIPTLYVLSEDFSAFTSFTKPKIQKRGSFIISLDELDPKMARDVFLLYQKASFSGPLALNLGGSLFGFSIRKYLRDTLVNLITTLQNARKSYPDIPDLIISFIKSQPTPYRIDYDSEDINQLDYTVSSESFYESSNQYIQKALDTLG